MSAGVRRQPGLVSVVDVGCAVWSTTRRLAGGGDGHAVGGVAVAVTEKADVETGEVDRAFLVFDHEQTRPFIRWARLAESEVNGEAIEALDVTALKKATKRLAEDVAYVSTANRRLGSPNVHEARCLHAIATLTEIIMGPGARADCQKVLNPIALATQWRMLCEDIFHTRSVWTLDTARRAFAAQELAALVYGADGLLHGELEPPAPAEPIAPRPYYPPAHAQMFVE